jgi:hypothetical protein
MSNPVPPPQPDSSAATSPGSPGDGIRIGDAERTEVADRLARHFSDGRLDEAEFGERLDQAMHAKTMADLVRLLADLPSQPAPPQQGDHRHQRKMQRTHLERERLALKAEQRAHRRSAREARWRSLRLLVLVLGLVIGAVIIAHWLAHSVAVWIIIGVIAFFWVRRNAARGGSDPDNPRRD